MIVAALDIGGTHVSGARVDPSTGAVDCLIRAPFAPGASRAGLLAPILDVAAAVARDGAACLGVAVPGPFDYLRGISRIEHKLEPLNGIDLRRELADRLGLRPSSISFVNDAEAFVIGEWWAGAAAGHARVVGVTLGTGVGSAFLDDGKIVDAGPRVPPEGSLHLLSHRGDPVEETISRTALIARYGSPEHDVEEIATRARAGEERARTTFSELATALADVVAPWLASFDATCLVVGGSIARAWDLLEPGLREGVRTLEGLQTLAQAMHVDEAALLGAARYASNHTFEWRDPLGSDG